MKDGTINIKIGPIADQSNLSLDDEIFVKSKPFTPQSPSAHDLAGLQTIPLPGNGEFEGRKAVFESNCALPPIHYHNQNILVQVYSGKLFLHSGDHVTPLGPGDFFFTPAYCPHKEVYVGLKTTVGLLKIPDSIYPNRPTSPTALTVSPVLKALYDEIIQWSEVGEHCTTQQQKFIELFTDLLSSAKAVQRFDVGIPQTGPLLDVAMQLIAEPNNGNNLDEWAARAKMSRRTFSRAFRDATGDSFLQWRLRLKIAISMKRLACGEDVKSISYDLGFRHASHFSSEFKSQTGMCPRQFAADPHVWNVSLDLPATYQGPLDAVRGEDIYSSI